MAEVLNLLNPDQLNRFNAKVREILPNIHQVAISKTEDNQGQVKIWTEEKSVGEDELGFTIDQCGSGVGQVLSILYVLMDKEPKVLLIDEPQSFLHPNAARKLVETIRASGNHHQIVIATHAPSLITGADPSTVNLIKQEESESEIKEIDISRFNNLQTILGELGGRFSDVFVYDRVIWVEGPTEEKCFSIITKQFCPLFGTAILRVQNTGDIDGKKKDLVNQIVSIYERLSFANNGLIPTNIDFIFDRETRSAEKLRELEKLGFGIQKRRCVHFISKRLYENYLINSEAIAAILNEIDGENSSTSQEINQWIDKNKNKIKYYKNNKIPTDFVMWKDQIDGAKFLSDLFAENIRTKGIEYRPLAKER